MKKQSLSLLINRLRICMLLFAAAIISLFLFSFTANKLYSDFFKQLGISKLAADKKITNSILGGHMDAYGLKNITSIALGDRSGIAKDLLLYTKEYVNSDAFKAEYTASKQSQKPVRQKIQSPEEMKAGMLETYIKSIAETEENLKKADATMKPIYLEVLTSAKEELKKLMDPNNDMFSSYAESYPMLLKQHEQSNKQQLEEWETKYPYNHLLFVKQRLQEFLHETNEIDFSAALTEKNGKKFFVNPAYEQKSKRWKMAFRAGKEVVDPARLFVQQWMDEIK